MGLPDDLLEQAYHLANRERKKPRQASLRRAVSTGYYALFHLLTHEATLNWRIAEQRPTLARIFEHGKMKIASERRRGDCHRVIHSSPPPDSQKLEHVRHLYAVADTFVQAQQQRHRADYDNSKQWTRTEVLTQIDLVGKAFESWREVRKELIAQDYLISLLGSMKGT